MSYAGTGAPSPVWQSVSSTVLATTIVMVLSSLVTITPVEEVIRVRTGERGEDAL